MASNIRRLVWNTRERLTSTDLNDFSALHHRALIEGLRAILTQDNTQYGVIRGFVVTSGGASLSVSVSPGLALTSGTAPTTYDSNTEWVELSEAVEVNLSSLVDATNPRWVIIEIADPDSESTELSSSRDVWVPASGTATSQSLTKVRGSEPTLNVRAGTAAVTPYFPAGTAGSIPLAYVYIPAATATIGATDVVLCRPMIVAGTANEPAVASGGGVQIPANSGALTLRAASGRMAGYSNCWSVPGALGNLAVVAAGCDGAALPIADDILYLYAIPAPYPAGHDATLAPREFRPGTTAATRFSSLVPAGVENCVVVASTKEPTTTSTVGAPSTLSTFSVTAAPFSSSAVTCSTALGAYLGALAWDLSVSGVLNQRHTIGGIVSPLSYATTGSARPSVSLHDGTSFIGEGTDIQIRTVSSSVPYPVTAKETRITLNVVRDAVCTDYNLTFTDELTVSTFTNYLPGTTAGSDNYQLWVVVSDSGTINFSGASAAPTDAALGTNLGDTTSIDVYGYRDCILAAR